MEHNNILLMNEKEKMDFLEKINKADDSLVEAIKDHFHLLTLSSFAIVIANFSRSSYPKSYQYALISSILFLCSFICQILKKTVLGKYSAEMVSIFSLLSNFNALFFFILIVRDYSTIEEEVGTIIGMISQFPLVIILGYFWVATLKDEIMGIINYKNTQYKYNYLILSLLNIVYGFFLIIIISSELITYYPPIYKLYMDIFESKVTASVIIIATLIYTIHFIGYINLTSKLKKEHRESE